MRIRFGLLGSVVGSKLAAPIVRSRATGAVHPSNASADLVSFAGLLNVLGTRRSQGVTLMSFRWLASLVAAAVASFAFAANAQALTVGEVTGVEPITFCESVPKTVFLVQTASSGASFTVPSTGIVTHWSTSFGKSGSPVSMIVLRPEGSKSFKLVGADSETLPTPIPSSHVSSFSVAAPFLVQAGDVIGLQVPAKSGAACVYATGSKSDTIEIGEGGGLTPGTTLASIEPLSEGRVNVAVELTQSADLALTQAATPSPAPSGSVALIQLNATNATGVAIPATVTDVVPAGLPVLAAGIAGEGTCTVAGQAVTCELGALSATATTVDVIVGTPTPGSFTNQALITGVVSDPNPSNNSAGATITVQAPVSPPTPSCTVISLAKTPLTVAEAALRALHCGIGKVTKTSSKTVAKGLVISTSPGVGATLAAGSAVNIVTSSGPPKTKKHKKKKKH